MSRKPLTSFKPYRNSSHVFVTYHEQAQGLPGLCYARIQTYAYTYVHFVTLHFLANVVLTSGKNNDDPYSLLFYFVPPWRSRSSISHKFSSPSHTALQSQPSTATTHRLPHPLASPLTHPRTASPDLQPLPTPHQRTCQQTSLMRTGASLKSIGVRDTPSFGCSTRVFAWIRRRGIRSPPKK